MNAATLPVRQALDEIETKIASGADVEEVKKLINQFMIKGSQMVADILKPMGVRGSITATAKAS